MRAGIVTQNRDEGEISQPATLKNQASLEEACYESHSSNGKLRSIAFFFILERNRSCDVRCCHMILEHTSILVKLLVLEIAGESSWLT